MTSLKRFLIQWFLRPLFIRLGISRFSKQGLNGLDDKLAPYLNFRNGVFVELGANNGISQSNTFYLEKLKGWRGVLIEPLPRLYEQAKKNRQNAQVFNAACVPFGFEEPYIEMMDLGLMSFVDGALTAQDREKHLQTGSEFNQSMHKVRVPTKTLNDILISSGVQHIDFLSLDVEGYEASVLQGLDLERFAPRYLLIEARYRDEVEAVINSYYETVGLLTVHDVLYQRKPDA